MCGTAQSKFKSASAGIVAAADCSSVSVGLDSGHYEGPLRMRLPVRLSPGASAEGAWSFEIPLPDPSSQKLLSRSQSFLMYCLSIVLSKAALPVWLCQRAHLQRQFIGFDKTCMSFTCRLIGGLKAALNSPPALVRSPTTVPHPHQRHKPSEAEVSIAPRCQVISCCSILCSCRSHTVQYIS